MNAIILDFYRQQSPITDPGEYATLYDNLPDGLHELIAVIQGQMIHRLTDAGNTVIVIEHNLDVIRTADWVIDLGPEGGEKGGYIVAEGTPEQVSQVEASHTGRFLKEVIGVMSDKVTR